MYTANWCPAEGEFSSFSWERKVDIRIDRRFQNSTERFRRHGTSMGLRSSWFFVLHDCHIAQVAVKLLGIEAESHHEAVGNLKTAVIDGHLHDAAAGSIEERTNGERIGRAAGQVLQEVAEREAGIDDILDQQHVLAFDAVVEILGDAHHAGSTAAVGEAGDTQEIHLDRNFDDTVGGGEKKDSPFEDTALAGAIEVPVKMDFLG